MTAVLFIHPRVMKNSIIVYKYPTSEDYRRRMDRIHRTAGLDWT